MNWQMNHDIKKRRWEYHLKLAKSLLNWTAKFVKIFFHQLLRTNCIEEPAKLNQCDNNIFWQCRTTKGNSFCRIRWWSWVLSPDTLHAFTSTHLLILEATPSGIFTPRRNWHICFLSSLSKEYKAGGKVWHPRCLKVNQNTKETISWIKGSKQVWNDNKR